MPVALHGMFKMLITHPAFEQLSISVHINMLFEEALHMIAVYILTQGPYVLLHGIISLVAICKNVNIQRQNKNTNVDVCVNASGPEQAAAFHPNAFLCYR